MSRPRVSFADLRRMLLDMGFTETVVPKSHVFFAHPRPGAEARTAHLPAQPIRPTASSHLGGDHAGRDGADGSRGLRRFRGSDLAEAIGFMTAPRHRLDPPAAGSDARPGRRPTVGSPRTGPVRSAQSRGADTQCIVFRTDFSEAKGRQSEPSFALPPYPSLCRFPLPARRNSQGWRAAAMPKSVRLAGSGTLAVKLTGFNANPSVCPLPFHVEVDHVLTGDKAAGKVRRGTKAVTISTGPRTGHQAAAIQAVLWRPTSHGRQNLDRNRQRPTETADQRCWDRSPSGRMSRRNTKKVQSPGTLVPVELLAIHSVVPVNLPVTAVAVANPVVGNDENEPSVPPTLTATCH